MQSRSILPKADALIKRSGERAEAPRMGKPAEGRILRDAPGDEVRE
jgi:hypothetical protein